MSPPGPPGCTPITSPTIQPCIESEVLGSESWGVAGKVRGPQRGRCFSNLDTGAGISLCPQEDSTPFTMCQEGWYRLGVKYCLYLYEHTHKEGNFKE